MLNGVITNLLDTLLTIYHFLKNNEDIVKTLLVLVFSLILSYYITNYKNETSPKKFKRLCLPMRSYRLFWTTSASSRKKLVTLFILALSYLIFLRSLKFNVIENVSYSIVAAFIFDAFLNYHQENERKKNIALKWGIDFSYHRIRWDNFLKVKEQLCFTEGNSELINEMLNNNQSLVSKLPINNVIYDRNGILPAKLTLATVQDLEGYAKHLISIDAKFISSIYYDPDIFIAFPNMKASSYSYHQFCHLAKMSIDGTLINPDIIGTLENFFNTKNKFTASVNENIGLYR
ncbi:hypothetical protein ACX64R_18530 [Pantoea dispersa]